MKLIIMQAEKIDFKVMDREYYRAGTSPTYATLSEKVYLSLNGEGRPDSENFQRSIEVLYTTAFQLKAILKKMGMDFVVSRLECLWWMAGGVEQDSVSKGEWRWRLLIRVPDFVSTEDVNLSKEFVMTNRKMSLAAYITKQKLKEGRILQVMHVGPYDRVGDTYSTLSEFMKAENLEENGPYHEIYISDPAKIPPERLKTIIRIPVRETGEVTSG